MLMALYSVLEVSLSWRHIRSWKWASCVRIHDLLVVLSGQRIQFISVPNITLVILNQLKAHDDSQEQCVNTAVAGVSRRIRCAPTVAEKAEGAPTIGRDTWCDTRSFGIGKPRAALSSYYKEGEEFEYWDTAQSFNCFKHKHTEIAEIAAETK